MYISLLELMEDNGIYEAKLYKSSDDFYGPYITARYLKDEQRLTAWYRGEEIYSRPYDFVIDDGVRPYTLPNIFTTYDFERIKEKCETFWVRRNKK